MKMVILDEYQCEQEGHLFYVEDGAEPMHCPVCGTQAFDYTNTVEIGGKQDAS